MKKIPKDEDENYWKPEPDGLLYPSAVNHMILKYGFYSDETLAGTDKWSNPNGPGIVHGYNSKDDGVIYDTATELYWQKSGSFVDMNFEEADHYIKYLNRRLKSDGEYKWRLPRLAEAMSLMEPETNEHFMNIAPIFDHQLDRSLIRNSGKSCLFI